MSLQPVLTFDGLDDYIEIPYSEKLTPKVFTMSCWAKFTKVRTNGNALMHQGVDGEGGYDLFVTTTWSLYIDNSVTTQCVDSSLAPILNIWTHLAATFDGSKAIIYVNGQATGEKKLSYLVNTSSSLLIGSGYSYIDNRASYFFAGQIAEVCIWNKARTQQEIQLDMGKRLTGKEVGLVGYWPLNEGSGNTATDKTSNGKNGIIRGATWSQQEIPINPAEPTTGEFQVPINSLTGIEFTNKLAKDSSYKFTPSGTWKTPFDNQERTAAGLKGFPPEIQPFYIEELKKYQQYLKYPNNTYLALLAVNKTTGVVTEVTEETTIVLRAGETLTFLVNYFPTEYQHNTGTLTVKWSAT